jgi:hypothetical protein
MSHFDSARYQPPQQPRLTNAAVTFKKDVLKALDGIEGLGDFATFHQHQAIKSLSVTVKDVGLTAMPLQEAQARQIIEKARLAPFGKGSETVVDTSVRNTWELNPDQFELGSDWQAQLNEVCRMVAVDMGIQVDMRAELYKMLIYEKGAMFQPHTE